MQRQRSALQLLQLAIYLPAISHAFSSITLTSQDFESKTQAATGQTTGIWFVLFTSSGEASLQHLKESWDEAARSQLTEAVPVYHAVVDIEEQPFLAERFNIQALPAFLLFRNRKMYKYGGVDTGADALTSFAKHGYRSTAELDVPKEVSPVEVALKQLKANSSMAVGAAACLLLAAAALLLWKQGRAETAGRQGKAIASKEDAKTK